MAARPLKMSAPSSSSISTVAEHPFDEKYFRRLYKLLRQTDKVDEATAELHDIFKTTLAFYEKHNWKEFYGPGTTPILHGGESDDAVLLASSSAGGLERVKRHEKPVAPVKKAESAAPPPPRPSVIKPILKQSPKSSPNSSPRSNGKGVSATTALKTEEPFKKKPKLEIIESAKATPSPTPTAVVDYDLTTAAKSPVKNMPSSAVESSCLVCNSLNPTPGNTLMQCDDCGQLFHQLCHEPSVPSEKLQDPRYIFNCSRCTKKRAEIKKRSQNLTAQSLSAAAGGSSVRKSSPVTVGKAADSELPNSAIFKRTQPQVLIQQQQQQKSQTTVASLAADFLAKRGVAKAGALSKSPTGAATNNANAAERGDVLPTAQQLPAWTSNSASSASMGLSKMAQQVTGAGAEKNAEKRIKEMKKKATAARQLQKY